MKKGQNQKIKDKKGKWEVDIYVWEGGKQCCGAETLFRFSSGSDLKKNSFSFGSNYSFEGIDSTCLDNFL